MSDQDSLEADAADYLAGELEAEYSELDCYGIVISGASGTRESLTGMVVTGLSSMMTLMGRKMLTITGTGMRGAWKRR